MAWNSPEKKTLANVDFKVISPGAPVSYNTGAVGKPYRDGWDIERAYKEGVSQVVWVYRAIEAIAGNQARLPFVIRKGHEQGSELVKSHPLLKVLNSTPNKQDTSFNFRYRLSSQLLMSTRGAFVEVIRSVGGDPLALHLLPPQSTSPVPHPTNFVSGYEVALPNGQKKTLKPKDVIWIRKPHPLDPYLSTTPMEPSGIAIEIERLAKLYNRNFLLNDGRPGGLLVVKGELDPADSEELRSRFRGNLNRSGSVSVISSDDGADYIDTGSNPRDASYVQMRGLTKEEILAAFGVPESVIGNASGRTFSNAAEEGRVFWMETMLPHLEMIARSFDALDDNLYTHFNTESVPILILNKQEQQRYLLSEYQSGLISLNEYREGTGRKKVDSELADSMLVNPNLTPIGNTEKKLELPSPEAQAPVVAPEGGGQELPPEGAPAPLEAPAVEPSAELLDATKDLQAPVYWDNKMSTAQDRWAQTLEVTLDRFLERQHRVISEKSLGKKSLGLLSSNTMTTSDIFNEDSWDRQIVEDVVPVLKGAFSEAVRFVEEATGKSAFISDSAATEAIKPHAKAIAGINLSIQERLSEFFRSGDVSEKELGTFIDELFAQAATESSRFSREIVTSYTKGMFFAGLNTDLKEKVWVNRTESGSCASHSFLQGQVVGLDDSFSVNGKSVRFPGDDGDMAYADCRCSLRFRR